MLNDPLSRHDKFIDRRQALKTIGGALAATALASSFPNLLLAEYKRPNIIFILSDDHRWDMLGSMGHPFIKTPHMDRLAKGGVLFSNAFVTTSLCSPSRACFITGQYAHKHGVKNNITPWNNTNITFLELLKQAGYDTAFIGKWHMPGKLPKLRGVDEFITFTAQGGQGQYYNCPLIIDGRDVPSHKPYITEELTDYALDFMSQKRDNPFCMYLAHKAVHHQYLPPPATKGMYRGIDLNLPPESDPWITWSRGSIWYGLLGPMDLHFRMYCETLVALDQQIGRVLDKLDELGIADNTIVIYAGDNGYFWGEHRLIDKRWPYEESIRIPFIVRYPKYIRKPGRKAEQMVLNIDLAPTVLDLAGIAVPSGMDGMSITPILKNSGTSWRKAWLYEYFKDYPYQVPEMFAIRTDRHKYIEYQGRKKAELFDIVKDPREMQNMMNTPEGKRIQPELKKKLEYLKQGGQL